MAILSSEKKRARLSAEDRAFVLQAFETDRTADGARFDFESWVERIASGLGVDEKLVRYEIAQKNRIAQAQRNAAARTLAMEEADLVGACQMEALITLRESLQAVKHIPVVDKDKMPILNENGEPQFFAVPDNATRVRAACALLDVYGAKAPKKVEISGDVTFTNKTELELKLELQSALATLQKVYDLDVKPMEQIES